MAALALSQIEKSYAGQPVLRDLSVSLNPGTLTLLLGANGAGKTTLLRIAAGLSRPARGSVAGAGRCAYIGHALMLYGALTVRENMRLFGALAGDTGIDAALAAWDLSAAAEQQVGQLSKGLQYRASLCRALLGAPKLVLLDEPSAALDERSFALLEGELRKKPDRVTLVATHDLHRLTPLADRVLVLHGGKIDADSDEARFGASATERMRAVLDAYRTWNR